MQNNQAIALFKLYEVLPMTSILSFITVLLIVTFFVTSSDSGSLVIDSLASGGALHTPVWQRVFWASSEGIVAATLLLAGGLSALQTMTIVSALPFSIIMIISAAGMWRALMIEDHHSRSLKTAMHQRSTGTGIGTGGTRSVWRDRLHALVTFPSREEVLEFMDSTVRKAMVRVERELVKEDWQAQVVNDEEFNRIYLEVIKDDQVDFIYEIRLVEHLLPNFAYPEMPGDESEEKHYYRAEVFLRRGGQSYDVYEFNQQDIITDILDQFEKHLHFLHISPAILPWRMEAHDEMLAPPPELTGEAAQK